MSRGPWNAIVAEWLSGLFMAPLSPDVIAGYRDGAGQALLESLANDPATASGARRMREAITTGEPIEAVHRVLSKAFTLLFDGAGGPRTVSPYESAYVGPSGRLFQGPAQDMARLLRRFDVALDDKVKEPADHLSVELALFGRLIRWNASQAARIELLDEHLLTWVPGFASRCHEADHTGFYAGAATVLAGFLTDQRATLGFDARSSDVAASGAETTNL